jgi:N-acyl-D-amino-acid deacylase
MFDVLIQNSWVVDGSGRSRYKADIAVAQGKIVDIGQFPQAEAGMVINAQDRVVCPGFIDVHSHSELRMLAGKHTAGVQMGVTTEFTGADGFSFAPLTPAQLKEYQAYLQSIYGNEEVGWDWTSLEEYIRRFEGQIYNNLALQVPHGVLRLAVKGWQGGAATDEEIERMARLARRFMELGAVGFNTGLDYAPASHSDLRELVGISRVVGEYGGVYAAHMRGYSDVEREKAIAETLAVAEGAGVGVHISHFFGDEQVYASTEQARQRGIDITFDSYCYPAGCTALGIVLPRTLMQKPVAEFVEELKTSQVRTLVANSVEDYFPPDSPAYISYVSRPHNRWMEGHRLREVWGRSEQTFGDFVCDLLIDEAFTVQLVYPWVLDPTQAEERMHHTLTHPLQMLITDGLYNGSFTHPRGWGNYPRMLGVYVREKKWLSLEDAVRRMTSFPAQRFGLKNRGLLEKDKSADLVVFDPQTIRDAATFENPRLPPIGIDHVFVNGSLVCSNGRLTSSKAGQVIQKG